MRGKNLVIKWMIVRSGMAGYKLGLQIKEKLISAETEKITHWG